MLVLYLQQSRQVGGVAVHAVKAFDDDQHMAKILALLVQQMFEMVVIVVAEFNDLGVRAVGAGDDAVMRQFVDENSVALAHQPGDRRDIGEIAGDQRQRALEAQELGDLRLERLVRAALAANQPRGQRADAEIVEFALGLGDDARVIGESEIVVIGEADEMLAGFFQIGLQFVDLREEGIGKFEQRVAGETEPPRRIVREASVLRHLNIPPESRGARGSGAPREKGAGHQAPPEERSGSLTFFLARAPVRGKAWECAPMRENARQNRHKIALRPCGLAARRLYSAHPSGMSRCEAPACPKSWREQCGAIAQLGERFNGIEEVVGSIPSGSTNAII